MLRKTSRKSLLSNMWEYMELIFEQEKEALLARKEGKSMHGGGGWPTTAARSP